MNKSTNQESYLSIFKSEKKAYQFNHLDFYFADFLMRNENINRNIFLFLMYLSMKTRNGDICIDLAKDHILSGIFEIDEFISILLQYKFAGITDEQRPVVIDGHFIYLNRFYRYEKFLSEWVIKKSRLISMDKGTKAKLGNVLPRFFNIGSKEIDWQKFAVLTAVFSNFSAISGGPGTGKTTTIAKLFLIINEIYDKKPVIKLCAPTGKAASRLSDAIVGVLDNISYKKKIDLEKASTIHRLLKFNPETNSFKYNKTNRLKADIIIVDEASMIDLKLMTHLAEAVPEEARVILLGDRFQLASVSPGSVFADICGGEFEMNYSEKLVNSIQPFFEYPLQFDSVKDETASLRDSVVELKKNYRFSDVSSIAKIADSIREDNIDQCLAITAHQEDDLEFIEIGGRNEFFNLMERIVEKHILQLVDIKSPEEGFKISSEFAILSPVKDGYFGVENINFMIENMIRKRKKISLNQSWYNGKLVIMSRNDYRENLFNGDIGVTIVDNKNVDVYFDNGEANLKKISPVRLSSCKPFYATTVHKSQGSEFDNIYIVIPEHFSRVLTKELLYTAVTRAKKKVVFIGNKGVFKMALEKKTERRSGLAGRLRASI